LDDSRKDFRAASSRSFGVGDSAEVYAVISKLDLNEMRSIKTPIEK